MTKKQNSEDLASYVSYDANAKSTLDNCARIVIRQIANYGASYFLNPNVKLNSGTYSYSQYIHNNIPIVEKGFLKFKILMLVKGSYKIHFGKHADFNGIFSISMISIPVSSLAIDGHVKIVKNEVVSKCHYTYEGKSLLKHYKYVGIDIIKVSKTQVLQPRPAGSDNMYR